MKWTEVFSIHHFLKKVLDQKLKKSQLIILCILYLFGCIIVKGSHLEASDCIWPPYSCIQYWKINNKENKKLPSSSFSSVNILVYYLIWKSVSIWADYKFNLSESIWKISFEKNKRIVIKNRHSFDNGFCHRRKTALKIPFLKWTCKIP